VFRVKGDAKNQLYLKTKDGDPVETYTNMEEFKANYPDDPTVVKFPDIFDLF
jgi:hypothetical protein